MLKNRPVRWGLTKRFVNILSDHKRNPRYERQDRVTFHILVPNPKFVDLATATPIHDLIFAMQYVMGVPEDSER
jgi:hypothetical protein